LVYTISMIERAQNQERIKEPVAIERALPDDVFAIEELRYQTWLATYPNEEQGITAEDIEALFKDRHAEDKTEARQHMLEHEPRGVRRLVARKDGKIVGFAFATKYGEMNELTSLYVLPEYQRQGVGQQLWDELCGFIDPHKETFLSVASYNKPAISFYESLGFRETDVIAEEDPFELPSGKEIPEMYMLRPADMPTPPSGSEALPRE
jgi:ribosomal protein S18 acetylase RimI-like enzyme